MLLVCLHIHLFRLCIKKDAERGVTFKIFYLPSHTDIHSAHAELKHPLFVAYKSIVSYLKVQFFASHPVNISIPNSGKFSGYT